MENIENNKLNPQVQHEFLSAKCFVCDEFVDFSSDVELNSFEVHLLRQHKVIIPKFNEWNTLQQFVFSIETFHKLINSDRCSSFLMKR